MGDIEDNIKGQLVEENDSSKTRISHCYLEKCKILEPFFFFMLLISKENTSKRKRWKSELALLVGRHNKNKSQRMVPSPSACSLLIIHKSIFSHYNARVKPWIKPVLFWGSCTYVRSLPYPLIQKCQYLITYIIQYFKRY